MIPIPADAEFLPETSHWEERIYQYSEDDVLQGGPDGIDNIQTLALANRTLYLRDQISSLGTGKLDSNALMTALAALATSADKFIYFTGANTPALGTVTAFIRTLMAALDATSARGVLGVPSVAEMNTAVANLVNAAPATLDTIKELADALGSDPNFAATVMTALGGKQAADATLTALAAVVTSADKLIYATGDDTFSTTVLTPFIRTLLDDPDAAAALATLGGASINQANTWAKAQSGIWLPMPATAGTVLMDFTAANLFTGQATGNITFGNGYTGPGAGKGGALIIRVQQGSAALYNWAFASNWKHIGGAGAIPGQTQTLGAWDTLVGQVLTDGTVEFAVRSDVK